MRVYTQPFVTPLAKETETNVRLVGTGSYLQVHDRRLLITCEHVAREKPLTYRFNGSKEVFTYTGCWTMDPHPTDCAFALLSKADWDACEHQAVALPISRFAPSHRIVEQAELLFFRGYSGENARYGFGVHETNGSGYCSQEKLGTGDDETFELFWEPDKTQFTDGTAADAKKVMKYDDPSGFSGSLVWNTRYLEVSHSRQWAPEDAAVTGLLRRWDQQTNTLLVWRVEHMQKWLEAKLAAWAVNP